MTLLFRILCFTCLFWGFTVPRLWANTALDVKQLTIEDGLSNNDVNCIFQASDGQLWLGTMDGLNKFDAYSIRTFRKQLGRAHTIVHNHILALGEDAQQQLLVATAGGLLRMHAQSELFEPLSFLHAETGIKQLIQQAQAIVPWKSDRWIATSKQGLLRYRSAQDIQSIALFEGAKKHYNYTVSALHVDRQGKVYTFIEGLGLALYQAESGHLILQASSIKSANALLLDARGRLIVGSIEGIYILDKSYILQQFYPISKSVISLFEDRNQQLWASTDGAGVFRWHELQGSFKREFSVEYQGNIHSNVVKQIWEDKQGRFWFATRWSGVNMLDLKPRAFQPISPVSSPSLKADNINISSFAEDADHNLWIGSDALGLYYWDRAANTFSHKWNTALSSNNITSLCLDKQQNLWVASWQGAVQRFHIPSSTWHTYPLKNQKTVERNFWKLFKDSRGDIYVSSYGDGSLYRWQQERDSFELVLSNQGNILEIVELDKHGLWLGTETHLIYLSHQNRRIKRYMLGVKIRAIRAAEGGRLWVGTEGAGLMSFSPSTGKYRRYTENEGLSNNNIVDIQADDRGNLWLSTFRGLNKFSIKNNVFSIYTAADGLQSNQFIYQSSAKLANGQLVFGGVKGFNIFDPAKINTVSEHYRVQLLRMRVNGEEFFNPLQPGEFKHDQSFFSFEFSAFPFFEIDKISYAVLLKGHDRDWVDIQEARTVNYSKLPAGNYELWVRYSKQNAGWNKQLIYRFHIFPVWYATTLAYSCYILIFCLGIYSLISWKQRKNRLNFERQFAALSLAKEKEIAAEKLRSLKDVVGELSTPLTLIINPLEVLMGQPAFQDNKELRMMARSTNRLLVLSDQLKAFHRSEDDPQPLAIQRFDLLALLQEEFESFVPLAEQQQLSFHTHWECSSQHLYGNREKIALVIFHLLDTAFKAVDVQGSVALSLQPQEQTLQIRVSYTSSQGLQPENMGKILINQFVHEHQGSLGQQQVADNSLACWVQLPLDLWNTTEQQASAGATKATKATREINTSEDFWISNKKKIFLIDANEEYRFYIRSILEPQFLVFDVSYSLQVMALIEQELPDLIIVELTADEQGYALCKTVKQHPQLSHIPVVFINSFSDSEAQLKSMEVGGEAYYVKPFKAEILKTGLQNILESRDKLQQFFFDRITLKEGFQGISSSHKEFLEHCMQIVADNLTNPDFNAKELAKCCHMSYSNLYKKVRALSGLTISGFIRAIRLRHAAVLLLSTEMNIGEVAFQVGIQDVKYFREKFKDLYQMTPSAYMKHYRMHFNSEFNFIKTPIQRS